MTDQAPKTYNKTKCGSADEWAKDEEKRRAWWAVFKIDTFSSATMRNPFIIDVDRTYVHLPAPDENWYDHQPVVSTPLLPGGPHSAWKSLVNSPNKSEYAWFLVANYIMRSYQDAYEKWQPSSQISQDLYAVQCFALSLPSSFHLCGLNLDFDESNFGAKNWIILTHIMIQTANCFIVLRKEGESLTGRPILGLPTRRSAPLRDSTAYDEAVKKCGRYTHELFRAVRYWTSDFIPSALPFIACALMGPAGIHIPRRFQPNMADNRGLLQRHLLDLVLKRVAEYWAIGSLLQDFVEILDTAAAVESITVLRPEIARVRVMMPDSLPVPISRF